MNNPEYCQRIYEAAEKVVKHYTQDVLHPEFYMEMLKLVHDLKRALEGKDT